MQEKYSVEIHNVVLEKIDSLYKLLSEENEKYFLLIYDEIFNHFELLEDNPFIYPVFTKTLRKMPLPRIKFNVYYGVDEEHHVVEIVGFYRFKQKQNQKIIERSL